MPAAEAASHSIEARVLAAVLRDSCADAMPDGNVGDALVSAARQHDVGPLVYRALCHADAWEGQPRQMYDALAKMAFEAAVLDELGREDVRRVLEALAAAGLAPLVFKGTALAHRHYPEPWLRPRLDTDLLIRENEQAAASAVFERMGFARFPRPTGAHVTHQFAYSAEVSGVAAAYDVHWKIADPQVFADVLSYDELVRDAVPLPSLGPAAQTLSDVHALLVACVHRVAHHFDTGLLLFLCDIDLLARQLDEYSWNRFVRMASERRIRQVCIRGLALAADRLGTPVPSPVLDALAAGHGQEPSASYLRERFRRVDILQSDLRALEWRARGKLLREHLLPRPSYILESYGRTQWALLPALYLHRIVRGALHWFRPLK